MLDEERICIMTRMASYEAGEGKEDMPVKQYYRKDYISYLQYPFVFYYCFGGCII